MCANLSSDPFYPIIRKALAGSQIPTELVLQVEVFREGRWYPDGDITPENWNDYNFFTVRDDFDLCYFLTGIKLDQVNQRYPLLVHPLASPRGVPKDINLVLRRLIEECGGEHYSWFTLEELWQGLKKEEERYDQVPKHFFEEFKEFLRDVQKDYTAYSLAAVRIVSCLV